MTQLEEWHKLDLAVECPAKGCTARINRECKGVKPGLVHFGRRVKRLLSEKGKYINPRIRH